jgi:hypothetical protein
MVGLYPRDFRARFGREMSETLRVKLSIAGQAGWFTLTCVALAEACGLFFGVAGEWIVKLASDPMSRARSFPDCSRMRPVGITRQEWGAGLDDV